MKDIANYKKAFEDAFGVSVERMEDVLVNQYKKEKRYERYMKSSKAEEVGELDVKDILYKSLSDPKLLMDTKFYNHQRFYNNSVAFSSNNLLVDEMDAIIAALEEEENINNKKNRETKHDLNATTITSSEEGKDIANYYPEPKLSYYYCFLYYIVCLNKSVLNTSEVEIDSDVHMNKIMFVLSNLVDCLKNCYKSKSGSIRLRNRSLHYLRVMSEYLLKKGKLNELDLKFLQLSVQLIAFVHLLLNSNMQKEKAFQAVAEYISIQCAKICTEQDDHESGIRFSVIALHTDDPKIRQDAFNIVGVCAIEKNQYQFAYNIYFSWIYKHVVGISEYVSISEGLLVKIDYALKSSLEQTWRDEEDKKVALMYGNFAYVCGMMYDKLKPSECKEKLQNMAKYYITLATQKCNEDRNYHCSAGTIFWDCGEYQKSIFHYKEYYDRAIKPSEKVDALRMLLTVYNNVLDDKIYEKYRQLAIEFLNIYKELSDDNDLNNIDEIINGRDLYYLLSKYSLLSDSNKNMMFSLLRIENDIRGIRDELRWKSHVLPHYDLHISMLTGEECNKLSIKNITFKMNEENGEKGENQANEIAYYTTFQNLQFLFEDHLLESGNEINCLTMMHMRYMNDPEEGLILLKNLEEYLPNPPEEIRNGFYDQKNVFVKSFTGLVDKLNMWTTYGSDISKGKDCNGCCVCIAPETFDRVINLQEKSSSKMSIKKEDDFHLYNVAYMVGDKIMVGGIENENVNEKYGQLTEHLSSLKKELQNASEKDLSIISNSLTRSLGEIMFLFKDSSYQLETESRLIITRDIKDRLDIHKTRQDLPKLYINPPFQVYPEKIILGPKTENAEYWIPYLQYELTRIGEKWDSGFDRKFNPVIRLSSINIR